MLLPRRPPIRTRHLVSLIFPPTRTPTTNHRDLIWELLSALPINPFCRPQKLRYVKSFKVLWIQSGCTSCIRTQGISFASRFCVWWFGEIK